MEMKFFLFWESGGCNDGDHNVQVEEFTSAFGVLDRLKELYKQYGHPETSTSDLRILGIINGYRVDPDQFGK